MLTHTHTHTRTHTHFYIVQLGKQRKEQLCSFLICELCLPNGTIIHMSCKLTKYLTLLQYHVQLLAKRFIDRSFAIYIPYYDKHVKKFSFMNVRFLSQQMFEGCPYINLQVM